MLKLVQVDETTFINNVNELESLLKGTLLTVCKNKEYLAAEIYVAIKKLFLAYSNALDPEVVKHIEKSVHLISEDDYKVC